MSPTYPPDVSIMTPVEVVWGEHENGEFWWSIDANRVVQACDPEDGEGPSMYALIEGKLCIEHGMEGEEVGLSLTLEAALEWLSGGDMPSCGHG